MTANPSLRLLAIDPGLAHVGIAIVNVTGIHQLEISNTWSTHSSPENFFLERMKTISLSVLDGVEETEKGHLDWYAVVEDPRSMIQSDRAGQRKDPRRLADLNAAFGMIAMDVKTGGCCKGVELTPVMRWYPRNGRSPMRKKHVIGRIRERYPELAKESEHVCMAVGLADWWSGQVAPVLWAGRVPAIA